MFALGGTKCFTHVCVFSVGSRKVGYSTVCRREHIQKPINTERLLAGITTSNELTQYQVH